MILVIISLVCFALISITMVVRANELVKKGDHRLRPWAFRIRIIGCALVATTPIGIVGQRLVGHASIGFETFFLVGLLCVFVTTPNKLPWWRWVGVGE